MMNNFKRLSREASGAVFLENNNRVIVVGGGPAGAFFARELRILARRRKLDIRVTVVDRQLEKHGGRWRLSGCNYCAGVISPRLTRCLADAGICLPPDLIGQSFSHVWLHGTWKNFPYRIPPDRAMVSVFRGPLPPGRECPSMGLDPYLLDLARKQGATLKAGTAEALAYDPDGRPCLTVRNPDGSRSGLTADFCCIAAGAAADSPLMQSFRSLHPGFQPPLTRPALVFELKPGRRFLERTMNRELFFLVSGAGTLDIDHIALVPKGDYLTVTMAGRDVDKTDRADTPDLIRKFLALGPVREILPGLDAAPVACSCRPRLAMMPSVNPHAHRIGLVGDALGARLFRDGLYSAFVSATAMAATLADHGLDKASLERGTGWVTDWLEKDNRYGRRLFRLIQYLLKSRVLSRIAYQSFATEMKFSRSDKWPLGNVLWKIGSGGDDYRQIFRELFSRPVLASVLTGAFKTLRNGLTERFFGLSWDAYGRYPTVILKEKRDHFKQAISAPLGLVLPDSPEMERMYAIKIRASARAIFRELGKFGTPGARFLRLRFVGVTHVSGMPNREGAVIRYRLQGTPVAMDVRLTRAVPDKSLLYDPADVFCQNGRLIFDIRPTRDGNQRLVVYTAFDYKRGTRLFTRIFWGGFRRLFPDFAHDVVWNHAMCRIKADAEKGQRIGKLDGAARQSIR